MSSSFLRDVFKPSHQEIYDSANLHPTKPIWSLNLKDNKELLEWTKNTYNDLVENASDRAEDMIRNIYLVKGVQFATQDRSGNHLDRTGKKVNDRTVKLNMNKMLNFVNSRAARLARFPVNVSPVPHNNSHSDNEGARAVKDLLETFDYKYNLRSLKSRADRKAATEGEAIALVTWSKDKGEPTKRWLDAKKKFGDKKGKVETKGETFEYDPERPELTGDIELKIKHNWEIGFDPGKERGEDVEWIMTWKYEHVEKVKKDYKKVASEIQKVEGVHRFDANLTQEPLNDHTLVIEVFARSTKYLPNGGYWKCTTTTMLEPFADNPYLPEESQEFGNLPIVRLKDIEVEGEFHGYPTVSVLAPAQYAINQFTHMIKRSAILAGHPKIAVPKQSKMNTEALGNDMTIFHYNAPYKPEPMISPQVSGDTYNFMQILEAEFDQTGGQNAISKGQLPSNIRSGRQIRLLEEIESLQAAETVTKSEQFIANVYRKMLAIAQKFYKEDDERLIQVMGKDKKYRIDAFKRSSLNKSYDILIMPSTSLPQTPAARIAAVAELFQIPEFNTLLPKEQWADMLDLGTPGKFYDAATAAITKAEMENEKIVNGQFLEDVDDGDGHIAHWKVHNVMVESPTYNSFSPEMKAELKTHIMVHEMKMMDKAAMNPAFAQALFQLPLFPKYFIPLPVMPQLAPVEEQGGGQAEPAGGVPQQGSGSLTTDVQLDAPPEGLVA